MNEPSLNDAQWKSLEAQIAANVPQMSLVEQQQILYQCAFAAGQKQSSQTLRRWQTVTGIMVVLLLCMTIPLARDRHLMVKEVKPSGPTDVAHQPSALPFKIPFLAARPSTELELDAWQFEPTHEQAWPDQLAQLEQADPHLRSLAVSALTRATLNP